MSGAKGVRVWDGSATDIDDVVSGGGDLGGTYKIRVEDMDTHSLLCGIYKEMKILNLHLEAITDNHFIGKDTE